MSKTICQRTIQTILLLMAVSGPLSCVDENNSGGPGGQEISFILSAESGVDISQWQFISARTENEEGVVWQRICAPLISLQTTIPIEAPATAGRLIVDVFSGADVCEPNGGGILLARGIVQSPAATNDADALEFLTVPLATAGQFSNTYQIQIGTITSTQDQRMGASSTHLSNGVVLVTGGGELKDELVLDQASPLDIWQRAESLVNLSDSLELYDPATGLWTLLTEPGLEGTPVTAERRLPRPRMFHHSIYLAERNLVAIVGGYEQTDAGDIVPSSSIVLIDLTTMTPLPPENSGSSRIARVMGTVNTIDSPAGTLLFLAGGLGEEASNTYEVILPGPPGATGEDHILGFGTLPRPRWNHTATQLTSRAGIPQIYLIGGEHPDGLQKLIDIFDIENKRFFDPPGNADAVTGLQETGRIGHSTIFVPRLNALYVIGGYGNLQRSFQVNRIEVIDADTGAHLTTADTGFALINKRAYHNTVILNDSRVLVTGGLSQTEEGIHYMAPADEIIGQNSASDSPEEDAITVQAFSGIQHKRANQQMIPLINDQVLVFGGFRLSQNGYLEALPHDITDNNSELYTPIPTGN